MSGSAPQSGRLVAISNRTGYGEARAGGLAIALCDALESSKGLWAGWSGKLVEHPAETFKSVSEDGIDFALCDYSEAEHEGFYLGYSNSVLWPVMHGRVDLAKFEDSHFQTYREVNQRFADGLLAEIRQGDMIWVHDYHFILLAALLAESGWQGACGFFLHIPFPSPDTFRTIPDHQALARGLCAYDLIGLQTERDVANLMLYLEDEFGAKRLSDDTLKVSGRTLKIQYCPIGIDADGFAQLATNEDAREASDRLAKFLRNRDLVIGVDRMDYSKGLPQRFEGMARFFDQNPDLRGRVSYTQIAPPSRSVVDEYVQLRERLDALSGRINGDYGDLDWIPVRYLARGYRREELAGLYRLARVGLVTPLFDGMNLVAKEFIAAQDPDDPGVLVLSQFAGAAEQMQEALIINPHDPEAIAGAVRAALDMSLSERKRRWQILYKGVCEQDIAWWRERYLSAFRGVSAGDS